MRQFSRGGDAHTLDAEESQGLFLPEFCIVGKAWRCTNRREGTSWCLEYWQGVKAKGAEFLNQSQLFHQVVGRVYDGRKDTTTE